GIIIADVSGKGLPAALFMASTRSIVRAKATTTQSPSENFTQANTLIAADAARGMFVTVFYMELDPATRQVTYVNCGHNPPFWYQAAKREFVDLRPTGAVMGINASLQWKQDQITMNRGDVLTLYTDGITEAFNEAEEEFGDERLKSILIDHASETPEQILAMIHKSLEPYVGAAPQWGDRTMGIVQCV